MAVPELYRMFEKNAADTNYRAAGPARPDREAVMAHEGTERWPHRVIVHGSSSSIGGGMLTGAEVNELVGQVVVGEPHSSPTAVRL